MDLTRLVDVALFMAPAALTTLVVAAIAFPLALSFAVIVTVPRVVRLPVLSCAADLYVDFVRTTPLLLHLSSCSTPSRSSASASIRCPPAS